MATNGRVKITGGATEESVLSLGCVPSDVASVWGRRHRFRLGHKRKAGEADCDEKWQSYRFAFNECVHGYFLSVSPPY
jgi:hypothetical protein